MSASSIVAQYIHAYCLRTWPEGVNGESALCMASTVCGRPMMDVFDHKGHGSHKYIPGERLTIELGMKPGAGVYGYWRMYDNSYVLLTCEGPLAHWSGQDDDPAKWGQWWE